MRELILGGVRSGKSRLAERCAGDGPVTYIATARSPEPGEDDAMAERIRAHREHRPAHWTTVEAPMALGRTLARLDRPGDTLLVDCLTLWLTNVLIAEEEAGPEITVQERTELLDAVASMRGRLILVSNETGLGVLPMNALARRFCDEAGSLHQALAEHCERVIWCAAGLPQVLKGAPVD